MGTSDDPTDLKTALAAAAAYGVVVMADGIYEYDDYPLNLTAAPGVTIQAAPGARPLITRTDGTTPRINFGANMTIEGLWCGGERTAADRAVTVGDNLTLRDCVFFGYNQSVSEGASTGVTYDGCTWALCGNEILQHAIYVSNSTPGHTSTIQDCVFVGGNAGGYQVHLWHDPTGVTIDRCFIGGARYALVTNGTDHAVTDCVLWSGHGTDAAKWPLNLATGSDITYSHILFGSDASDFATGWRQNDTITEGTTVDACTFIDNTPSFGTNPATWAEADCTANLGYSKAAVDAAVAALEASFAEAPATVQADATIAGNLAICRAVVAAWTALGA